MRLQAFIILLTAATCLALPLPVSAWKSDGHRVVGAGAVVLLDSTARASLVEILGSDSDQAMGEICSWADTVRDTHEWSWSARMHYVNIPRSTRHYLPGRDCADGMCAPSAIVKYANELNRPGLNPEQRKQALAWVCHLVGDLHQPLHAGYRDDLGGNAVDIEYKGESYNLHRFWDAVVINENLAPGDSWSRPPLESSWTRVPYSWYPQDVMDWTDESHALATRSAYPPGKVIDQKFSDQTWLIIREQWQKASYRLAQILNATLGDGEIVLEEFVLEK